MLVIRCCGNSTRGASLVEALVALLVLSIGMLGVAAMQIKAMQGSHVAYQRGLASLMTSDARERLWATLGMTRGECPSAGAVETDWQEHWADVLPSVRESSAIDEIASCTYSIIITWQERRLDKETSTPRLRTITRLPRRSE
ncbi:type IV pilus modification PilV family protein [Aidingimonas halophila]|uniref:Type IV pilus assembly protein PilV n=1 Tax=Aidingimonas halophila TaxID=574349 RepID=A0A1H3HHS0_9GAMM|nr:prepilin-type N-terminal cleavage/methylation domain-containing protein [Aidingimonas halophila]GHC37016.1 hypothetical protein GCM10008094_32840 [Aidingimonas halophila]SDY14890.1 type IV pilus assembly protein PilV [Aidingimonas halophila]